MQADRSRFTEAKLHAQDVADGRVEAQAQTRPVGALGDVVPEAKAGLTPEPATVGEEQPLTLDVDHAQQRQIEGEGRQQGRKALPLSTDR